MKINNNIPPYAEEQIINQEIEQIQEILNQLKKPIPSNSNFKKLEPAKKNNWGSTEDLDKPLCERYLFTHENKRIWLDIPYTLMEKLELPVGKTCPLPFYLKSEVLDRDEIEGAITIESEKEIFLDKPVSEKNMKKELVKRLKELEKSRERVEELKNDDQLSQETIINLQCEIASLEEKIGELEKKQKESEKLKDKLEKDIKHLNDGKKELDERIKELEQGTENENLRSEIRKQEKEIKKLTKIITMFIGRTEWLEKNFLI